MSESTQEKPATIAKPTPVAAQVPSPAPNRRRILIVPGLVVAALTGLFYFALKKGDPSKIPSALIGKPVPQVTFIPVEGLVEAGNPVPAFDPKTLAGGTPTVVNFWASWCLPCVDEHPLLIELAKRTGVTIVGVNYKDQPVNARRFLSRYGNPFKAVGADPAGSGAIEWGVYGMPETFVVDGRGIIVYKHVGPISPEALEKRMIPAVEAAKASR